MLPDDVDVASIEDANAMSVRTNAIVIAYVGLVVLLGVLGNAMVFIYHGFVETKRKKTVTTFLITVLALNDLIASAVLSNHIIILRYLMNYESKLGCQITYFVNHFFVTNSLLLLNPIGIERCLRVCIHNPRYHLTKRKAIVVLCVMGVYSIGVSLRHVWVTGVLTFEVEMAANQTVTGHVCSFLRDNHILPIVELFNLIDILNFATTNIVLIIVYSVMAKKVGIVARKVNAYPVESHTSRNTGTQITQLSMTAEASNENSNTNTQKNANRNLKDNIYTVTNTNNNANTNCRQLSNTHSTTYTIYTTTKNANTRTFGSNRTEVNTSTFDSDRTQANTSTFDGSCTEANTSTFDSNRTEANTHSKDTTNNDTNTNVNGNANTDITKNIDDNKYTDTKTNSICNIQTCTNPTTKDNTTSLVHPTGHVKTNNVNVTTTITNTSSTDTGTRTQTTRRHDNCERKINVMLGTVTLASILIFMPYFYVVIFIRPEVTPGKFTYRPLVQLAWKSFLLNSTINPYIIGLFNSQFRKFVINLMCRCKLQSVSN